MSVSKQWQQLLNKNFIYALESQQFFAKFLGGSSWSADLNKGTITFPNKYTGPVEVIGSSDDRSNTWLWGWANQIPNHVLNVARSCKQYGEENNIKEFTSSKFKMQEAVLEGHMIASIVSQEISNGDPYYRGPNSGGAAWLIIKGGSQQLKAAMDVNKPTPLSLINLVTSAISIASLSNHRDALKSYLTKRGIPFSETENSIEAEINGKAQFTFNEDNLITNMQSILAPNNTQ